MINREYHKLYSTELQRDMELLVFGHAGRAVLFFPTRMARFYDYENWGIVGALYDKIENGELQLFCVDSIDAESFYNKEIHPADRIKRHQQYESYLLNEVLPMMQGPNGGRYLMTAGCSMGAYHAMNIGLRHPQLFRKIVSMSGRYDLTIQLPFYDDLFDGFHNEDIYFNMPRQYLANLTDDKLLDAMRKLEIIIAIGEEDPFLPGNQQFHDTFLQKELPHQFYIWDGNAHRPRYWRQMVSVYL
jgi:esterase/lipase superfamily enzyme